MRQLWTRTGTGVRRSHLYWGVAGAVLAAVLVSAGLSYAQTAGNDEYSGCLSRGGSITKVAVGSEPLRPCRGQQTAISWNQRGAQGPAGIQGVPGLQGPAGPGVDGLRADVDMLLEVIQIDPVTGAVTINSPDDLILAPSEEVMVMADAMLEGDTTMMQDTTVMGETMLEGDTMLMADAEIMGDTTFEGGLVLPATAAAVDAEGLLTPTSSAVTLTGFNGVPLLGIPVAASDGTVLEINFAISSDVVAGGVGFVDPCSTACGGVSPGFLRNIDLKQRPFEPFRFEAGDTLRLISRGDSWVETSRSSGQVEVFTVVTVGEVVSAGATGTVETGCSSRYPPSGREGAVLLTNSVRSTGPAIITVDAQWIEVIEIGTYAGTEALFTTITNTSAIPALIEISVRCLSS